MEEASSSVREDTFSCRRESTFIKEQNVPSSRLQSIKFEMMTSVEMEKYSNFTIVESNDLMTSKLGLPSQSCECSTCGGTHLKQCDGHVGIIKLPTTIFHPYFAQEAVQILNDTCPGCKSLRQNPQNESTILSKQASLEVQSNCKYCFGYSHEWPSMKFKIVKDKSDNVSITVEVPKWFKDKDLSIALPKDYWDFIPNDGCVGEFLGMKVLLSPSQVFYLLKELDEECIERYILRRELLFLSSIPVTPNCNRITEINTGSGSPKVIYDDRTRAYKKLVDARRKLDEIQQHLHSSGVASTQVLGCVSTLKDERTRSYRRVVSRRKVDEIQQHCHHPSGVVIKRVLECLSFSKLHPRSSSRADTASSVSGLRWVKDVVLCKRTDFACRMTVVGDSHIGLCEIGIPADISCQLFVPESITSYNQHVWNTICSMHLRPGDIFVKRRGMKLISCFPVELQIGDILCICREGDGLVSVTITLHNQRMWTSICNMQTQYHKMHVRRKTKDLPLPVELHIGDILFRPLQDGDLLLVNRPPSVHQHSLIALSAKILPTKSVFSINPLCCAPFSGDFDGDCLHVYVPQSVHSKVELTELVHLDKQLLNGQDDRSLISLSQDSLTAAYLLTGDMVFLRKHEMQQLHMSPSCLLKQPAIVKAPSLTSPLWTGQQLFSSVLPENLYFSVTSKTIHISEGEILVSPIKSSWLQNSVDGLFSRISKCYGVKALDYFFLAQEVFSEWISIRGFSVSLEDIYLASNSYDRAKLIQDAEYGMQEAEYASYAKNLLDPAVVHLLEDHNGKDDVSCITGVETDRILYQKNMILNEQSFAAFKDVFNELQHIVHEYARKDNSMLSMIRAGSKGNLMKLLHQGVCLGLQHSRTFLSFSMPPMFSCPFLNQHKVSDLHGMVIETADNVERPQQKVSDLHGMVQETADNVERTQQELSDLHGAVQETDDNVERLSSYAVIKSSFLDGLNPFECFLHSLSGRMNLFSENAEFPGTLTRKLMFYMRDLYFAYDGSVRNSYGQQVIQFNYNDADQMSTQNVHCEREVQAGQPVGALAACAVSEAAYSALDLPSSSVEISPLLKLKNLFECGRKSTVSELTITLALSKKLRRWDYGFEYAALEVKKHLERVFFSDIVSAVLIFYAGQDVKNGMSPWIIHFHLIRESLLNHKLNLKSIEDVLNREYKLTAEKLNTTLPKLHISSSHLILACKLRLNFDQLI